MQRDCQHAEALGRREVEQFPGGVVDLVERVFVGVQVQVGLDPRDLRRRWSGGIDGSFHWRHHKGARKARATVKSSAWAKRTACAGDCTGSPGGAKDRLQRSTSMVEVVPSASNLARVVKWQTRTFEGRMPQGMGVQVPPRALSFDVRRLAILAVYLSRIGNRRLRVSQRAF